MQAPEGTKRTASRVREVGHGRLAASAVAVAVVLLLVQWPMQNTVLSGDLQVIPRDANVPRCEIPARLSLIVDALAIYAYVHAAWRLRWYVAVKRPSSSVLGLIAFAGAWLVSLAAVLDVVQDFLLWRRFGAPIAQGMSCPAFEVGLLAPTLLALWFGGAFLLGLALLGAVLAVRQKVSASFLGSAARKVDRWLTKRDFVRLTVDEGAATAITLPRDDTGERVICCSGGGIRAAAFSLGVLQRLTETRIYQKASSVVGVSGGGYVGAAMHIVRRSLTGNAGELPPLATGSPELARLRRQTRYLLPNVAVSVRAFFSLVFGVLVNLILIGVALRLLAWVLGWAVHQADVVRWEGGDSFTKYHGAPPWYWIAAIGPLSIVVAIFLAEVIIDRFHVPPGVLRVEGRRLAQRLTVPALLVAVLVLGTPWLLTLLDDLGRSTSNTAQVAEGVTGAVGTAVDSQVGVLALGGLGAALLALARSAWKGVVETTLAGVGPDIAARAIRQPLTWFRTSVVPWLGSALLILVGAFILMRWTASSATDPTWRANWAVAGWCAVLVVVVRIFTDATRTSLHPYYRERLANAYLVKRTGDEAMPYDYSMPMPFSDWGRPTDDGPQLVAIASANAFDPEFVPADRHCVPFVFDSYHSGIAGDITLPPGGLVRTAAYERRADYRLRDVTVPGAIAISGAAFSPLSGRDYSRTRPMRVLFAVVNARLGVWLPNPYWGTSSSSASFAVRKWANVQQGKGSRFVASMAGLWAHLLSIADKPGPYRLFKEAFGKTSLYDRRLYVTDGAHYDGLGLVEALRRKPAQIIVIDAQGDVEDSFASLGAAIATARMDLGVTVDIDPRPMCRKDADRASTPWVKGIAHHPDGTVTEVYVVEAVVTGQLPWDVESYRLSHRDFPRHPTEDQLYGEFDFESYRALGYENARGLADAVLSGETSPSEGNGSTSTPGAEQPTTTTTVVTPVSTAD